MAQATASSPKHLTRSLGVFSMSAFALFWIMLPLVFMGRGITVPLITLHFGTSTAFAWGVFALLGSLVMLLAIGWISSTPLPPHQRTFWIGICLATLILCWTVLPTLWLNPTQQPVPPLRVSAANMVTLSWFLSALLGSALALVRIGRMLQQLKRWRQQTQILLNLLKDDVSEGLALYDEQHYLRWINAAAQSYLFDQPRIAAEIQRLASRTNATGRTNAQSFRLNETRRITVEAAPLSNRGVRIIARPIENVETGQNVFYERFIRRIVHDMRNPLAAIIAHASNLQNTPNKDAAAWEASARTIEHEAQRLTRLVDSMLFDARLSYVPLALEQIDLGDVLEEVYFQHDERAIREEKTLEFNRPPDTVMVEADRDLLVRAFSNLVDNSLKYSQNGAFIALSLVAQRDERIITIADTGEGIPPEYLPHRIFEPLVRARSRDGGSGLGLAIVKKIFEMHHGSISVESERGVGTTMTVILPHKEGAHG